MGEARLCRVSLVSHQLPTSPSTEGINRSVLEPFQGHPHYTTSCESFAHLCYLASLRHFQGCSAPALQA